MIFLNSLFGYLSLLILVKWSTGSQADLYHVMIYMFLSPTDDLGENQLFPGQKTLQVASHFILLLNSFSLKTTWLFLIIFWFFPLPACITITGPCCCTLDANSKAFYFEEATPRRMLLVFLYSCYNFSCLIWS